MSKLAAISALFGLFSFQLVFVSCGDSRLEITAPIDGQYVALDRSSCDPAASILKSSSSKENFMMEISHGEIVYTRSLEDCIIVTRYKVTEFNGTHMKATEGSLSRRGQSDSCKAKLAVEETGFQKSFNANVLKSDSILIFQFSDVSCDAYRKR